MRTQADESGKRIRIRKRKKNKNQEKKGIRIERMIKEYIIIR